MNEKTPLSATNDNHTSADVAKKGQWNFQPEESNDTSNRPPLDSMDYDTNQLPAEDLEIHWTASEFIAYNKTGSWYVLLFAIAIITAGLIYLLTRGDKISAIAILVAALFFAMMARRKPQTLHYAIDTNGLTVGQRFYPYSAFKSFSVSDETAIPSITFTSFKRFIPSMEVYYEPKDEEKIVNIVSNFLPIEPPHEEKLDRFLKHIRF
jgi:hypothetical protein